MTKPLPTPEMVRKLLRYDPDTGKLYWRPRVGDTKFNSRYAGTETFTSTARNGYMVGTLLGSNLKAHRVIWVIVNGDWPEDQIDHEDGNTGNNLISNLRVVTQEGNLRNRKRNRNNTSGQMGVHWCFRDGKWISKIRDGGKNVYLGGFKDKDDAIAARKSAETRLGYHENHGRK